MTSDFSTLSATCNSSYPGKCLIYEQEKEFTLQDALAYCGKFNFTLLKIESMKENNMIRRLVSQNAGAWITASSLSDGSSRSMRFHPRCKSQCCGMYISSDGFWREDPCDRTHGIICQRKGVEEFPLLADLLEQMAYEQKILQKDTAHQVKDLKTASSRETSSSERQGKSINDSADEAGEALETNGSEEMIEDDMTTESAVTDESIVRVHTVIGSVTKASGAPIVVSSDNGGQVDSEQGNIRAGRPREDDKEEDASDREKDEYDYESKAPSITQEFPVSTESTQSSYTSDDRTDDYSATESASASPSNGNLSADNLVKSSLSMSIKLMMFLLATLAVITLVILMMHLILVKSRSASYEVPPEAGLISREYTKW